MTDLAELVAMVDEETGLELEQIRMIRMLQAAVKPFNAIALEGVTVSAGTVLSRDLSDTEARLMVLLAIGVHLRGAAIAAAKVAVVHSNVAGRTDLTQVGSQLDKLRDKVAAEITETVKAMAGSGAGDIAGSELGETLAITGGGAGDGAPAELWSSPTWWGYWAR